MLKPSSPSFLLPPGCVCWDSFSDVDCWLCGSGCDCCSCEAVCDALCCVCGDWVDWLEDDPWAVGLRTAVSFLALLARDSIGWIWWEWHGKNGSNVRDGPENETLRHHGSKFGISGQITGIRVNLHWFVREDTQQNCHMLFDSYFERRKTSPYTEDLASIVSKKSASTERQDLRFKSNIFPAHNVSTPSVFWEAERQYHFFFKGVFYRTFQKVKANSSFS